MAATGTDLTRPDPIHQPLLNGVTAEGVENHHGVDVIRIPGAHVARVYAGGSGWAPLTKVGEVAWDSAEFNVVLDHSGTQEMFRYGSDVAAGSASAMFGVFLSAMEHHWPVDVAYWRPEGKAPVVLGVALSAP